MSYPQPTSSRSVLEGQEFFRINTPIESNGDIYRIDTSVKAISIGPNSDVQNVRVWYYDIQSGNQINNALVSIDDPFITRMDAFMGFDYPGLGSKARVLITCDDIVPHLPGQPPAESFNENSYRVWFPPQLDVLCYHRDPPALPRTRGERQWQFPLTILDEGEGTGLSGYYFPHYRRKYFHVRFSNRNLVQGREYRLWGVNFCASAYSPVIGNGYPVESWDNISGGWQAITAIFGFNVDIAAVLYGIHPDDLANPNTYPMGYYDYMLLQVRGDALDGGDETEQISVDVISTDWA